MQHTINAFEKEKALGFFLRFSAFGFKFKDGEIFCGKNVGKEDIKYIPNRYASHIIKNKWTDFCMRSCFSETVSINTKGAAGMGLLEMATAPVCTGLFYLYIRDKYEKEPYRMLFLGVVWGIYTAFVICGVGRFMEWLLPHEETPFYTAFFSSAFIEESIKLLFLYSLIFHHPEFNEPFDGIVYAVFVSLGFAWIENLVYVTDSVRGGAGTALSRAVLSVPGHGLFGIQMGYYLAKYRFQKGKKNLAYAFVVPYFYHGLYNYFLLRKENFWDFPFLLLEICLWTDSFRKMRYHLQQSPFRPKKKENF